MDFKDLRDVPNGNGAPPTDHFITPARKRVSPAVVALSVLSGVLLVALVAVTTTLTLVISNNDINHHQYVTETPGTEILATYVPAVPNEANTFAIQPGGLPNDFPGGPLFDEGFAGNILTLGDLEIFRVLLYDALDFTIISQQALIEQYIVEHIMEYFMDWRWIDNLVRSTTGNGLVNNLGDDFAWECVPDWVIDQILRNTE